MISDGLNESSDREGGLRFVSYSCDFLFFAMKKGFSLCGFIKFFIFFVKSSNYG